MSTRTWNRLSYRKRAKMGGESKPYHLLERGRFIGGFTTMTAARKIAKITMKNSKVPLEFTILSKETGRAYPIVF